MFILGISWSGSSHCFGKSKSIYQLYTNDNNGSDIVFLTRNAADGTELDVTDDEKLRIKAGDMGLELHSYFIWSNISSSGKTSALLLQDTATAVDYFGVNVTSGISQLWYDDCCFYNAIQQLEYQVLDLYFIEEW